MLAVLHPDRRTDHLDLFTNPSAKDIIYSVVVAMLAYAGSGRPVALGICAPSPT